MAKERLKVSTGKLQRTLKLDRATVNEGKRTIPITFSSESPVMRSMWVENRGYLRGKEILSHAPGACDLSRLNDSHPLLVNHNDDDLAGVVEMAAIQDGEGRATVRFGDSARAEEIFRDVKSGVRPFISVGYRINSLKMEEDDCEDPNDPDCEDRVFRATSWTPYEVSSVPIPADTNARVRSASVDETDKREMEVEFESSMLRRNINFDKDAPTGGGGGAAVAVAAVAPQHSRAEIVTEITTSEYARSKEIFEIGKRFNQPQDEIAKAVYTGISVEGYRKMVLEGMKATTAPGSVPHGRNPEGVTTPGMDEQGMSVGERLLKSEAFRKYAENGMGRAGASGKFEIEFPDVLSMRTVVTASGLTSIQKQPGVVTLGQQPLTFADLLAPGETSQLTVRYIQENSYTQAATAVAENAAFPEATFDLTEVDATVRKIAVIGRISNEMNEDFPAVRSYVDGRLAFMVGSLEDNHLLNGTGINNQIKGILNFAGISTVAQGGDTVPDAIFKALTKVRFPGFWEPTAVIMHPLDWQNLQLTKDKNGQYLFGGPNSGTYGYGPYTVPGYVWGKPVVSTSAIAQGTVLTGSFQMGGQLFRRRGLTIEFNNSDASDFANDRVAIRGSTRIALAVYRPLGFCTVTGVS